MCVIEKKIGYECSDYALELNLFANGGLSGYLRPAHDFMNKEFELQGYYYESGMAFLIDWQNESFTAFSGHFLNDALVLNWLLSCPNKRGDHVIKGCTFLYSNAYLSGMDKTPNSPKPYPLYLTEIV
jgi:hypothetical protein